MSALALVSVVLGLRGVSADELSFSSEHLAQNHRAPGLTVVTAREITSLLGLERHSRPAFDSAPASELRS